MPKLSFNKLDKGRITYTLCEVRKRLTKEKPVFYIGVQDDGKWIGFRDLVFATEKKCLMFFRIIYLPSTKKYVIDVLYKWLEEGPIFNYIINYLNSPLREKI